MKYASIVLWIIISVVMLSICPVIQVDTNLMFSILLISTLCIGILMYTYLANYDAKYVENQGNQLYNSFIELKDIFIKNSFPSVVNNKILNLRPVESDFMKLFKDEKLEYIKKNNFDNKDVEVYFRLNEEHFTEHGKLILYNDKIITLQIVSFRIPMLMDIQLDNIIDIKKAPMSVCRSKFAPTKPFDLHTEVDKIFESE